MTDDIEAMKEETSKTPRTDTLLQWHGYKTPPPLEQRYAIVCSYLLEFELALADATAEIEKWRNGGVTEELLRKNDGAIRVGRGCVIVSAAEYDERIIEQVKCYTGKIVKVAMKEKP